MNPKKSSLGRGATNKVFLMLEPPNPPTLGKKLEGIFKSGVRILLKLISCQR